MVTASMSGQRDAGDVELHARRPGPRPRHVLDHGAPVHGAGGRRHASASRSTRCSRSASARSPTPRAPTSSLRRSSRRPTRSSTGTSGDPMTIDPGDAGPRAGGQGVHAPRRGRRAVRGGDRCRPPRCPACRSLEVGSYCGRSTVWLGAAAAAGAEHRAVRRRPPPRQRGEPGRLGAPRPHRGRSAHRADGHAADLPASPSTRPAWRTMWSRWSAISRTRRPGRAGGVGVVDRVGGAAHVVAFHASLPLSRPPPVSFSPPKAPPISAPLVPMLTLAMPQSLPGGAMKRSASRRSVVKIALDRPCGTPLWSAIASSSRRTPARTGSARRSRSRRRSVWRRHRHHAGRTYAASRG
jgi:hypothetical protein